MFKSQDLTIETNKSDKYELKVIISRMRLKFQATAK